MIENLPHFDNYKPIQDWVVLEEIERPEKSGEIFLPGKSGARQYGKAKVVLIGPSVKEVKVGDIILTPNFDDGEMEFIYKGKKVFTNRERHLNLMLAD